MSNLQSRIKKFIFYIIAFAAMFCGCSEQPDDQPVLPYNPEVGEWNPGMNEIRCVTKKGKDSRLGFETDAMITEKFFAEGQWIVRFDKTVTNVRVDYDGVNDSRSIISNGALYCAVCKGLAEYVMPEEVVSVKS